MGLVMEGSGSLYSYHYRRGRNVDEEVFRLRRVSLAEALRY